MDLLGARSRRSRSGRGSRRGPCAVFSGSVWAKISATVGDVAERDPHLLAGDPPAAVDLLGPGAQVGRVRAGVGLGQPEAAERLAGRQAAAASAASAPRVPQRSIEPQTSEVWTRDHGSHRRVAAADLLDDQPVAGEVEPAAAVLLGDRRAEVAHLAEPPRELEVELLARDRSRGPAGPPRCRRSRARSPGSAAARRVSSIIAPPPAPSSAAIARGERRPAPRRCAAPARSATAVDRSRPAGPRGRSRRGTPRWRPAGRRAGTRPRSTCERRHHRAAGDRVEDPGVERRGAQLAVGDPEDRRGRRLEHDPVGPHQQRLVGAAALGDPGRLHVGGVGERLDPVQDQRRRVGDRGQADGRGVVDERLDQRDPATAARDDQAQLRVDVAVRPRAARRSRARARSAGPAGRSPPPSARAGRGARRGRRGARRRAGSPRTRRRRGRGRRP